MLLACLINAATLGGRGWFLRGHVEGSHDELGEGVELLDNLDGEEVGEDGVAPVLGSMEMTEGNTNKYDYLCSS